MDDTELSNAIDELYAAFRSPKPGAIDGCPCCTNKNEICTLSTKELKTLATADLGNYACSVFLTMGDRRDFRYLLPRILELAATEQNWWPDPEVVLQKLKCAGWEDWSTRERAAIKRFLIAWFDRVAATEALDGFEIDGLICGLALAGDAVEPYLERLLNQPDVLTAFHDCNASELAKGGLASPFWNDNPSAAPVIAFLKSARIQERLSRA